MLLPRRHASRPRSPLRPSRRATLRRALSALLVCVAVAGLGYAVQARAAPGDLAVLVATRQLPVGSVVAAGDVDVRQLPAGAVPGTAVTDPAAVVGRPVAAVLSEGEVLTVHDVRAGSTLAGQPAGSVAVWLPVPDPAVARALSAGDRIDVLSPVDGAAVVTEVLVVGASTGEGAGSSSGLLGGGAGGREPGGVWLALSPDEAGAVAAARGADPAGAALLLAVHAAPHR